MRSYWRGCLVAASLAAATAAHAQSQDVVFEVEMLFQYDRLNPDPFYGINTRVRQTVTLTGKNTVRVDRDRRTGLIVERSGGVGALGQGGSSGSWRVVSANTIRGTFVFPQSVRTLTLTTTSGNACSVQVSDELKPGFKDFAFRRMDGGGMATFSRPQLVSSSCTVR